MSTASHCIPYDATCVVCNGSVFNHPKVQPNRYIVRREFLGDNETRFGVWDSESPTPRILEVFREEFYAERYARILNARNAEVCAVPQADGASE